MKWPDDLTGWPMAQVSRRVACRPHEWHVQEDGSGDTLLLLHGAGGATQSWRGLFPLLAETHHVIAVDLPGQGFSRLGSRHRCGLPHMAADLSRLIAQEDWHIQAIIGHSAGAALALKLALDDRTEHVIGINAALLNFEGVAGWLFPIMAKALSINPLTARMVAATANAGSARRLLDGTGSVLDDEGRALYLRLMRDRHHVDATLAMMAQWSLDRLIADMSTCKARVDLIAAENDQTVSPEVSVDAVKRLPRGHLHRVPGLGHLAHEEDAERIAELIRDCLTQAA
ncbi:MAG: alpha/beta fold hydrolase BchO [Pseudomonadota bacterium]